MKTIFAIVVVSCMTLFGGLEAVDSISESIEDHNTLIEEVTKY